MSRRAFTLMEILVALAIVSLIVAAGFISMRSLNDEEQLRRPFGKLRELAKIAWQRSIQEQRAWQIRFMPDHFVLEPRQVAREEDRQLFQQADEALGRSSGVRVEQLPPGIGVEIRHWGDERWYRPRPDVWVFEHSGICEPVAVRFVSEVGSLGAQFDPLTASVIEEYFEAAP
jgi:prepilin-type N-terminal cleavage/methylation domain-containing protein